MSEKEKEMSEEILVSQRKKKRTKYPFLEPKVEEEEQHSTGDSRERVQSREVYSVYGIRDEIKAASERATMQREMMNQERERMMEDFYTRRRALYDMTKSELGNMVKAVLADQTIKLGKGKQTARQHRKIAWGLIHRDEETSCEIELRRSGAEQQ
ncbi:MAG: hypothetical protein WB643_02410 [Candidatus Bathyarchaeia archaeon]